LGEPEDADEVDHDDRDIDGGELHTLSLPLRIPDFSKS
jgi:hypothetical protein